MNKNKSGRMIASTLAVMMLFAAVVAPLASAAEGDVSAALPIGYINQSFEHVAAGEEAPGFVSIANAADALINNVTVVSNTYPANRYFAEGETAPANNRTPVIAGNETKVLWINDNANSGRRGGYTHGFEPVSGERGLTASLDFMQPKIIGDSYPLELVSSTSSTPILTFSMTNLNLMSPLTANTWNNLRFVADTGLSSADVYLNGSYMGNYPFTKPDVDIAKIQARTAGSSTGSMYIDNVVVYPHTAVTPQALATNGADQSVLLSWKAASGAESYNVYRSDTSGGPYALAGSSSTAEFTDQGLTNKQSYYYVVTSVNANGESDYSNEGLGYPNQVQPPAEAPEFVRTDIRDSQLTLGWTAETGVDGDDNAVPSEYTLERSATPAGPFEVIADGISDTFYHDKHLRNGTDYYYRVTASNMGGAGPVSELIKLSPAAPLGAPALLGAEAGNGEVMLSWTATAGAGSYVIGRSRTHGGPYTPLAEVAGTSYTDVSVTNGETYEYAVYAVSGLQRSMLSNALSATPAQQPEGAPEAPAWLQATADEGRVSISWGAVEGAVSYVVKRSLASGGPYEALATINATAYEDTAVANGTIYYYTVAAVSEAGEGLAGEEAAALPARVVTVDPSIQVGATNFHTIQAAVDAISGDAVKDRVIISIAPGTYKEKLVINRPNVSLVGAGMDETVIVYGDYAGTSSTAGQPGHVGNTFLSQSVAVNADGFMATQLTIENSAAPRSDVAQAVALSLKGDKAILDSVRLLGFQDTFYTGLSSTGKGRHYIRNSIIQGDVDFIFGEAPAVVFDNVELVLASNSGSGGHSTAGAQKNTSDAGYVFLNSRIVDDASAVGVYDLGRPWKDHAKVRFINTFIDSEHFLEGGWLSSCAGSCLTYSFSEYNSYGPGANASARGIATQLTGEEASVAIPRLFADPANPVEADRAWDPTRSVAMPRVTAMPSVSAESVVFDRHADRQRDLIVGLSGGGHALTAVKLGESTLAASDYTATGKTVAIRKSALSALPVGNAKLTFVFGAIEVPLAISIIQTDDTDWGKQTLGSKDGWAAYSTGTKGGSAATPSQIFTV
ncbi:MAG: hypothetical protein K0Q63_3526, partial [Paenibacillus sp.]|nr:hypothetical protein [Paenibacillus sp.]